jgi:riboflavin synthase
MIPHSLKETTMGAKRAGDKVNIEYDIMGKYAVKNSKMKPGSNIDERFLKEYGFM